MRKFLLLVVCLAHLAVQRGHGRLSSQVTTNEAGVLILDESNIYSALDEYQKPMVVMFCKLLLVLLLPHIIILASSVFLTVLKVNFASSSSKGNKIYSFWR